MSKKMKCPVCNKTDMVVPIMYGYPSELMRKKAQKGEAVIGGCVMEDDNPLWYCNRDKTSF